MGEVLKSCPFCGGEAILLARQPMPDLPHISIEASHGVACPMLHTTDFIPMHSTEAEAIAAWNTRAPVAGKASELADELSRARVRIVSKNITDDREGWLVEVLRLLGLLEDNWNTILAALRRPPAITEEAGQRPALTYFDQDEGLRQLGLLYNYTEDDSRQFTRWQMLEAMHHGQEMACRVPAEEAVEAETFETINQWCDDTFGPATWRRMIERAKEEFTELEGCEEVEEAAVEAADVTICLCRIPGFAAALQAKMAVNRKRKWRLTGEGTGYHMPDDTALSSSPVTTPEEKDLPPQVYPDSEGGLIREFLGFADFIKNNPPMQQRSVSVRMIQALAEALRASPPGADRNAVLDEIAALAKHAGFMGKVAGIAAGEADNGEAG